MESHPAQPAAFFVGSQCRRGPTCPYLRRGRCLFFHPGDQAASASLVGRDQPPDGSILECLARLERVVEQILAALVPQITKDFATMSQHAPAERVQLTTAERYQPGDQVRRVSAAVHRQGCPMACCDATTGLSPPVPQIQEQIEEVAKTSPQRRISERIVVKTTVALVPHKLKEVAEVVKAVKNDVPPPQILEEIVKASSAPHEQVQQQTGEHCIDEQTVDMPPPQILEEIVEASSDPT